MEGYIIVGLWIFFFTMLGVLVGSTSASALRRVQKNRETYEHLQLGASTVVRYVEQMAWIEREVDGAAKKRRALLQFSAWTDENGINIPFDVADRLIEEAVNIMTAEGADVHVEPPAQNEYLEEAYLEGLNTTEDGSS